MTEFLRWCAADRDLLLRTRRGYPALSLVAVLDQLGWSVVSVEDDSGQRGEVDFEQRCVFLNRGIRRPCPRRSNETLAHELGHIRMHESRLALATSTEEMERQADAYARIFLVPRRQVLADKLMPRIQAAEGRERANLIYRMATRWDVTPGLMTVRLREVGVLP